MHWAITTRWQYAIKTKPQGYCVTCEGELEYTP